jgi:subtilisin-like proprotein convertase family protein
MKQILTLLIVLLAFIPMMNAQDGTSTWSQVENVASIEKTSRLENPSNFLLFSMDDYAKTFNYLVRAKQRFNQEVGEEIEMNLPMPDGTMASFRVLSDPIMEPELAAKFPEIKTYTLIGISNPYATAKVDFTPAGFHAMIFIAGESTVFIDPYRLSDNVYIVYHRADYPAPVEAFTCLTESSSSHSESYSRFGDCKLRRYRLALACTGEYAAFHGGTVALVLAAMNTTMMRVNGVFEKEAGVTMMIIGNNNLIIYLDAATDPYTNGNGVTMLGENQANCDAVIGSANYDIGHVFSTGGGGVATLYSPCNNSTKARGVTGSGAPVGDPFDIDFVAHEMGHQFGGNHTQNNSCQRSSESYEPGSASTIMGYAGICPPNVQNNSDAYYHAASLDEFGSFTTAGGNTCPVIVSAANNPPTANAGANYTIPKSTAFRLTGVGSDPDSDPITYCWEQYNNDVAPVMPPDPTNTVGPTFRSLLPKTSASRDFPDMGIPNTWEVLPSVARTMDFRLTVRDVNATYGYGCTEHDDMIVTVNAATGPFAITAPNGGENWVSGMMETVTWNIAGTNGAPINCANVDILLSLDGGATYPHTLATNTPNDGSQAVTLPNVTSTTARIRVRSVGNIFFDISDADFEVGADVTCIEMMSTDVPQVISATGTPTITSDLVLTNTNLITSIEVINVEGTHTWISDLDFSIIDSAGTEVTLLNDQCSNQDDFDMGFRDGGVAFSCPLTQNLIYNPTGTLNTYVGRKISGTWQLKIFDDTNQDGGQLNSWGLKVCYTGGGGGACDANLTFDTTPIATGAYYASNSILASVSLQAGAMVTLQSQEINMTNGFLVPLGAELNALIGPCQ